MGDDGETIEMMSVDSVAQPISQVDVATIPVKKNRALKIIIIVFAVLFILSIGTKIAIGMYITNKGLEYYEEATLPMIGTQLGEVATGEKINVTSAKEVDEVIKQARQHIQENYDRARTGEPTMFYTDTQRCTKNGITKVINEDTSMEFCDEGNGNSDCGDCTKLGKKETVIENLSDSIVRLYAEPITLFLVENVNDITVKSHRKDEGILDMVGATLEILQIVSKTTIMWADLIPMINDGEGHPGNYTPYIDWDDNSAEKLLKLEEFAGRIPEVTEEEINALNFKDACLGMFIGTYKDEYTRDSFSKIIYYVLEAAGFIPDFEDACELLDEHEKNILLKNLERSREETIPTLKIIQKYYLGMVVDCPYRLYDRESDNECTYSEDFHALYDEVFGIIREEEA